MTTPVPDDIRKAAHDATTLPLGQALQTSPYELIDLAVDAVYPLIVATERGLRAASAGCPSPAQPDTELAAQLFALLADTSSPRSPVPGGTWLRESGGSGSVVCDECGRLTADGIDWMNLAQLARSHVAETSHTVIVQASQSALYGPEVQDADLPR